MLNLNQELELLLYLFNREFYIQFSHWKFGKFFKVNILVMIHCI